MARFFIATGCTGFVLFMLGVGGIAVLDLLTKLQVVIQALGG